MGERYDIWSYISLQTALICLSTFLFAYNYLTKESWRNLPPGPPALPIVGSLPFLGRDLGKAANSLVKRYGHVITIYLGSRRAVVISGYNVIRTAYGKQGNIFSGRPSVFVIKDILKERGIVAGQGTSWLAARRLCLRIFRDFGVGQTSFENKILEEIDHFLGALRQNTKSPFFPRLLLQKTVCNVICSVTFGKRFDYEDPLFKRYMQNLTDTVEKTGSNGILTAFPILKHLPGDLFDYKYLVNVHDSARNEYRRSIQEHKEKLKTETDPMDFIDAFLQALNRKNSAGSSLTEEELVYVTQDLFNAGTETSSTTLSWIIVHLLRHPDLQERIHREIDDVIGTDQPPRMQLKPMLPFTEAFIYEVQRCSDIVPLGLPHATTEDVLFNGYFIPKGTMVIANMNSVNFDPDIWQNPHNFDPTRFLDKNGMVVRREELMPFSIGSRMCLGENLAKMELFLYFVSMMQHFRFRSAPGHPVPSDKGILGTNYMPETFKMMVEERSKGPQEKI